MEIQDNGICKHSTKVVMLPTEDSTDIVYMGVGGNLKYKVNRGLTGIHQHLYITVPQDREPIKEGDPFIENGMYLSIGDSKHISDTYIPRNNRKIIATTDPKLYDARDNNAPFRRLSTNPKEIQQLFLKEYVANPDGEFEVEYYHYGDAIRGGDPNKPIKLFKLKVNQDNTVNITEVKEKMYSRDQMRQAWIDGWGTCEDVQVTDFDTHLTDWIKENL